MAGTSDALAQHMLARIVADLETLAASGTLPPATAASVQAQLQPYLASAAPATPPPPPAAVATVEQQRFRAIWAYAAAASDELSFGADDVILVPASAAQIGDAWWLGSLERAPGVQGLFPSTYVEPLRPAPAPRKTSTSGRTLPPAYIAAPVSPVAADTKSPSSATSERKLGPPKWRPGVAQFSSNGAEKPPPSAAVASPDAAAAGPSAPEGKPLTPEEAAAAAKKEKLDKFGKKMGMSVAHGFAGGVGFGLARNIF